MPKPEYKRAHHDKVDDKLLKYVKSFTYLVSKINSSALLDDKNQTEQLRLEMLLENFIVCISHRLHTECTLTILVRLISQYVGTHGKTNVGWDVFMQSQLWQVVHIMISNKNSIHDQHNVGRPLLRYKDKLKDNNANWNVIKKWGACPKIMRIGVNPTIRKLIIWSLECNSWVNWCMVV